MSASKPLVSLEQVSKHNTASDCWIVIEEKVYKVGAWIQHHPGGIAPILSLAGKDATEAFRGFHPEFAWEKLKTFHVANLRPEDAKVAPALEDFRKIHKELTDKGFFKTDYSFYAGLAVWLVVLLISGTAFALQANWTGAIVSGIIIGLFWQQVAFIGHDLCHNAVTHDSTTDWTTATVLASVGGISAQWWKATHNVHHIVTNSVEQDPDIQHLPFLAITERYFKNVHSKYHKRILPFDIFARFMISNQHLFYYPVMAFARVNLYLQSFIPHLRNTGKRSDWRYQKGDFMSMVAFWVWLVAMVSIFPTWPMKLAFILISHSVAGILHVQITISHFGMPVNDHVDDPNAAYDFIKTQFEHSLDVECPRWMDWFHGGLQFQVVHHLFPRLPRHHLRFVRDNYIIPFAQKHGYNYQCKDFVSANMFVLSQLKEIAIKARNVPTEDLAPMFVYMPLPHNKKDEIPVATASSQGVNGRTTVLH